MLTVSPSSELAVNIPKKFGLDVTVTPVSTLKADLRYRVGAGGFNKGHLKHIPELLAEMFDEPTVPTSQDPVEKLDMSFNIYESHLRRLHRTASRKVMNDIKKMSEEATLLWYGDLSDLGYIRDAAQDGNYDESILGIIPYPDGTALFFLPGNLGFRLSEQMLNYYARFSSTISYYVPRGFPIKRVYDVCKYLDAPSWPLLSSYGGYLIVGNITMYPEDLKRFVTQGVSRFPISAIDELVVSYATFLLMDALNYQYDIWLNNRYLHMGSCSRTAMYSIIRKFEELVNDIQTSGVRFVPMPSFDEAAAVARHNNYKCFMYMSQFYAAVPQDDPDPVPNVDRLRRELIADLAGCKLGANLEKWSTFALTAVYRDNSGEACFTLDELSHLAFNPRYPEFQGKSVRDFRIWHFYVALGHNPPSPVEPLDISLQEETSSGYEPITVYYYVTTSGTKVPVARVLGQGDYSSYNRLFQNGHFFSRLTWNVYHEFNVIIEDPPVSVIDELSK